VRVFAVLLVIVVAACDRPTSKTVPSSILRAPSLEQKSKCTEAGWVFFNRLRQRHASDEKVDISGPVFAYNSAMNTCLCAYQLRGSGSLPKKGDLISVVIADVFANREVVANYRYAAEISWSDKDFAKKYEHLMGAPPEPAMLDAAIRY
jgi:hypothetical protein